MTSKTTSAKEVARILIVDDHPVVRRGLAELVADEPDLEVCGEAADAPDALRMVDETNPDLIVVDISLKSGHGIDLIKRIKARNDTVKMLVSSMHDETLFAERALRAGAMGYINKEEASDRVIEAIRHVLRGQIYLSSRMTEGLLHGVVAGREAIDHSSLKRLSDRELEVFEMIGRGMTTRQIAETLRRSVKTVETYRENLKAKLGLKNSAELSRHAVQWALERT